MGFTNTIAKYRTSALAGALALLAGVGIVYNNNRIHSDFDKKSAQEYQESVQPVEGVVLQKINNIPMYRAPNPDFNAVLKPSKCMLIIRAKDGQTYALNVINGEGFSKETVDSVVHAGDHVQFPRGNLEKLADGEIAIVSGETRGIQGDRTFYKRADRIFKD